MIGVVIGTALLSGCSEKHEANDTLPPPSAAETTEALPKLGPADFPVPDEARTKDAAGAEAFLRYFVDLSYAEIAEALEIRVGTVSATLSCAHRGLREAPVLSELAA